MKKPVCILLLTSFFMGCADHKANIPVKKDRYYFAHYWYNRTGIDTTYIDSLDHHVTDLTKIYSTYFENLGGIEKYANYHMPVDGEYLCYYTNPFGIIYTKSITWKSFSRLHSTNDSIENILNTWFSYIISDQSLVLAGENGVMYGDSMIHLRAIAMPEVHKK